MNRNERRKMSKLMLQNSDSMMLPKGSFQPNNKSATIKIPKQYNKVISPPLHPSMKFPKASNTVPAISDPTQTNPFPPLKRHEKIHYNDTLHQHNQHHKNMNKNNKNNNMNGTKKKKKDIKVNLELLSPPPHSNMTPTPTSLGKSGMDPSTPGSTQSDDRHQRNLRPKKPPITLFNRKDAMTQPSNTIIRSITF